jgi:hypothetical protein
LCPWVALQLNHLISLYPSITITQSVTLRLDEVELKKADGYYYLEIEYDQGNILPVPVQPANDNDFIELDIGTGLGDTISYSREGSGAVLTMAGREYKPE